VLSPIPKQAKEEASKQERKKGKERESNKTKREQ
jgi:hypothetical protein